MKENEYDLRVWCHGCRKVLGEHLTARTLGARVKKILHDHTAEERVAAGPGAC